MITQQTGSLATAHRFLEQPGARLNSLAGTLEACIEGARQNFVACNIHGANEDLDAIEQSLTKIRGTADALCLRKDQYIALHDHLIAVALRGEERYWT